MADYGGKASVPGYDIKTTVDYLQLFNSSWPLLKVGVSGVYGGTVNHNLGYPPFHFIATSTGIVDQLAGLNSTYGVNSTSLSQVSGSGTPRYYICRLDLTSNFDAPTISGGSIPSTLDKDYGLKISKPGKSVKSTDMRDFALNSSARSLMVHKVSFGASSLSGGNYVRSIPHGLPYIPMAFVFMQPGVNTAGLDADRFYILPPPVGVTAGYYEVDSTSVTVTIDPSFFAGAPNVSVVVLKDPIAKQTINVSYP